MLTQNLEKLKQDLLLLGLPTWSHQSSLRGVCLCFLFIIVISGKGLRILAPAQTHLIFTVRDSQWPCHHARQAADTVAMQVCDEFQRCTLAVPEQERKLV